MLTINNKQKPFFDFLNITKQNKIPKTILPVEIHTSDGLLVCVPELGIAFVGDTLEDSCTYLDEPAHVDAHLRDLSRFAAFGDVERCLPAHGNPEVIETGGYDTQKFIDATKAYLERLKCAVDDRELASKPLVEFCAPEFESGIISHFQPYDIVHELNVKAMIEQQSKQIEEEN